MRMITTLLVGAMAIGIGHVERPTVYMIGDSTMADRPNPDRTAERGWGTMLPRFLDSTIVVRNLAVNGRSTRSFIDEGRWDAVLGQLHKGDYVIIQFGHNDEKIEDPARFTNPYTAYRRNLERFVDEARSRGATPIVFSSIVRRKFNAKGVLEDTHGAYPFVAREVAKERGAPFVDLQMMTEDLVSTKGPEASKSLYVWYAPGQHPLYPEGHQDDTHLNETGATEVARLAAKGIRALGIPLSRAVRGVDEH